MRTRTIRSLASRHPILVLAPSLAALVACAHGDDEPRAAAQASAIVDTTSPTDGPSVTGDITPLGASATFWQKGSDSKWVNAGRFTDGRDLSAGAMTSQAAWRAGAIGDGTTVATSAFGPALDQALTDADTHRAKLSAGVLKTLFEKITTIPGVTVTTFDPSPEIAGWPAERGRWLQNTTHFPGTPYEVVSWVDYPDPLELAEQRERGARVYCASRQAQLQQSTTATTTMGEIAPLSFTILGKTIDVVVAEPTAVLDGPQRFTTALDGAQGFDVPLLLGTRFTLLRGAGNIGLDEVRTPVTLVTGDTEVATTAWISSGDSKRYVTVSHADAVSSVTQGANATMTVPLFAIGPIPIDLDLTVGYTAGEMTTGDDRVLAPPSTTWPGAWPGTTRTGAIRPNGAGVTYHDGFWSWPDPCTAGEFRTCPPWVWTIHPEGVTAPFWTVTPSDQVPIDTRARQDDDHTSDFATKLTLAGKVKGTLGVDVPFARVGLVTSGSLTGTVGQHHVVRDALGAQDLGMPGAGGTTMVTVRPRTTADLVLSGGVDLTFQLKLVFFTIDRTINLVSFGSKTLSGWDSDTASLWDETASMRIGTGSAIGDATKQPYLGSHLPQGADFVAMPQTVDACLADATPNPTTPPVCGGKPGTPTRVTANFCAYTDVQLPVCGDIAGWAGTLSGGSDAKRQCLSDYYTFLCEPVSYSDGALLSHIINPSDPATISRYAEIQNECVTAYVPMASPPTLAEMAAAKSYVESTFLMGVCDDSAKPMPSGWTTATTSTSTGAKPGAPCP